MSSIGVVLDACVLFPGSLRDILLRSAEARLYKLCLTDQIFEEMRRNLVKKGHMTNQQGETLVKQIRTYFDEAFETKHIPSISLMPLNRNDRHVLAAAVTSKSQIIVTQNLKDFPQRLLKRFEVEALSTDEFLVHQISQYTGTMITIIEDHVNSMRKPSATMQEALKRIEVHAPRFIQLVRIELSR